MPTVTITRTASWNVRQKVALTRVASWSVRVLRTLTRVASWSVAPRWLDDDDCAPEPCAPLLVCDSPFKRLKVSYMVGGGARISWEMTRYFTDPTPHDYQLQCSHGGIAEADDWENIGSVQRDVFFLVDPRKRMYGKTGTLYYRLLLTTPNGSYTSPLDAAITTPNEYGRILYDEIVRKEMLRHRLFGSVRGYLLKARRYGTVCSCVDALTGEVTESQCATCYGTGYVTGYYPPVPCVYSDAPPDHSRESRNLQVTGTERPTRMQCRFLCEPPIVQGDVFVELHADQRYYAHTVRELAEWRSVAIVADVELRLAPFSDVVYTIPIA